MIEKRCLGVSAASQTPSVFTKNAMRIECRCGSPPGVMMADTLSFNAKVDMVDF